MVWTKLAWWKPARRILALGAGASERPPDRGKQQRRAIAPLDQGPQIGALQRAHNAPNGAVQPHPHPQKILRASAFSSSRPSGHRERRDRRPVFHKTLRQTAAFVWE